MEIQDVERQHAATMKSHADRKGKTKAQPTTYDEPSRYKEAVEEKKGMHLLPRSHIHPNTVTLKPWKR